MKNPHRRVVLKMSHFTADCLLLQLSYAECFIRSSYGDDNFRMAENRAFYSAIHSTSEHENDNQVVVDVRIPERSPVGRFKF